MVQKTGKEVTVREKAGDGFTWNTALVKKHNKQDGVSKPDGKENSLSDEVGERHKIVPPTSSELIRKGRRN